jgi:hypothetical protein
MSAYPFDPKNAVILNPHNDAYNTPPHLEERPARMRLDYLTSRMRAALAGWNACYESFDEPDYSWWWEGLNFELVCLLADRDSSYLQVCKDCSDVLYRTCRRPWHLH